MKQKYRVAGGCTGFCADFLTKKLGVTFVWDWREAVEHCLFTDHLDEHLKEFIDGQKMFSNDEERWEYLFKNAYAWRRKGAVDFDRTRLVSFFRQWDIHTFWGTFSFAEHNLDTLEETLYWILLTGWILIWQYGKPERTSHFPSGDLNWMLQRVFQYPQKKCTWMRKRQFLKELKSIYDRSYPVFQYDKEHPNPNLPQSEWMEGVKQQEDEYSRFLSYHAFFQEHLLQPQIVRLNQFGPERYVRYLIKENQLVYYIQLSDFG